MKIERINEILKNKEIRDIYYDNKAVWIQELNNDIAKVGFIDGSEDQSVSVNDLYETNK